LTKQKSWTKKMQKRLDELRSKYFGIREDSKTYQDPLFLEMKDLEIKQAIFQAMEQEKAKNKP